MFGLLRLTSTPAISTQKPALDYGSLPPAPRGMLKWIALAMYLAGVSSGALLASWPDRSWLSVMLAMTTTLFCFAWAFAAGVKSTLDAARDRMYLPSIVRWNGQPSDF